MYGAKLFIKTKHHSLLNNSIGLTKIIKDYNYFFHIDRSVSEKRYLLSQAIVIKVLTECLLEDKLFSYVLNTYPSSRDKKNSHLSCRACQNIFVSLNKFQFERIAIFQRTKIPPHVLRSKRHAVLINNSWNDSKCSYRFGIL